MPDRFTCCVNLMYDIEIERWNHFCQNFIKIDSNHENLLFCQNFTFVQFDKLYYFSLFFYYFNLYLNIQILNNQNIKNMFFFKEVQTVRQRRGAIASLDLVYNSRNASIRHKGNFDGSPVKLQHLLNTF